MSGTWSDGVVAVCAGCGSEYSSGRQTNGCPRCGGVLREEDRSLHSMTTGGPQVGSEDAPRLGSAAAGTGSCRPLGRLTSVLQWIFALWVVFAGVGIAFRAIERSLLNRAARDVFSV